MFSLKLTKLKLQPDYKKQILDDGEVTGADSYFVYETLRIT